MIKIIFFLGISAFSFSVFAEEVPVQKEPQDIVTASPLEQFSEKANGWTNETISHDMLEVQGAGSLYDALNKSPGIQAIGEDSSGSPSIRIRGDASGARTLLLFDGIPINTQDGLGANPLLLPFEVTDNLEIIKGPTSLFYGSDAVGGAINIVPQKLDSAKVEAGIQSPNHSSLWLATPLIQSNKNFLQASIFADHDPGNFSFTNANVGTQKRQNNDHQTQRYILSGESDIGGTKISHHEMYAQEYGVSPGPLPQDPSQVVDFHRRAYLLGIDFSHSLGPYMDFLYKVSLVGSNNENFQSGTKTDYGSYKNIHSATISVRLTSEHELDFFTDFIFDHFSSDYVNVGTKVDHYFEHGVVWKGQIAPNEFVLAGLRYLPDENRVLSNALFKQFFSDYFVWASYSEGFRLPDFTQLYANTAFFVGNPNLQSESSNQIEVGLEKPIQEHPANLWDHVRARGSLFSIDYKNFIQYLSTPAPYSYMNIQEVTNQGAELLLGFDYLIYHGQISYSVMSIKDEKTNQPIPLSPTSQASMLLGAQLFTFIFEVQNTLWSSYSLDGIHTQGTWDTTDFSIRTAGFQNWSVRLGIQNIFNKERVFSYDYPEPGRKYFAFLERDF